MSTFGAPDTPGWIVVGGRSYADAIPELPPDVWELRWRRTGDSIRVTDPIYGNQRSLSVVEADTEDGVVKFAADEVSNGVFLFALPAVR